MAIHEIPSLEDPRFADFAALPAAVHAADPVWASGSEEATLWAFQESVAGRAPLYAVVVLEDGRPVARAAAFAPVRGPGAPLGTIGLFTCLPDNGGAGLTALEACEAFLARQGVRTVQAPRSDPLTVGLQVGGFDLPHTLFTTHHLPHHLDVLLEGGYAVRRRLVAPLMTRANAPDPAGANPAVGPPGVTVRHLDLSRLPRELAAFQDLHGAVFAGAPGGVARTPEDMGRLVGRILPYLDADLVVVAEHGGDVVGSLLCLPDAWQHASRIDRARILSIAVLPGWERRGIGAAMGGFLMRVLLRKGYQSVEGVWVRELNLAPQVLASRFGAVPGRRFAIMEKAL